MPRPMSPQWFELLTQPAPVTAGTRIRLTAMPNDPSPIPTGTHGTVTGGNAAQLHVDWDNGSTLMLVLPDDQFDVVTAAPATVPATVPAELPG